MTTSESLKSFDVRRMVLRSRINEFNNALTSRIPVYENEEIRVIFSRLLNASLVPRNLRKILSIIDVTSNILRFEYNSKRLGNDLSWTTNFLISWDDKTSLPIKSISFDASSDDWKVNFVTIGKRRSSRLKKANHLLADVEFILLLQEDLVTLLDKNAVGAEPPIVFVRELHT